MTSANEKGIEQKVGRAMSMVREVIIQILIKLSGFGKLCDLYIL